VYHFAEFSHNQMIRLNSYPSERFFAGLLCKAFPVHPGHRHAALWENGAVVQSANDASSTTGSFRS